MPQILAKVKVDEKTRSVFSTLAFFSLFGVPLSARRAWQLLYKSQSSFEETETVLEHLARSSRVYKRGGLYALQAWDESAFEQNHQEIARRWKKINRFKSLLALLPFIRSVCIINSIAMAAADSESDIDFFVITRPNRLYFVRSMIFALFRLLGVYKTRTKINNQFCFGFYVDSDHLSLKHLLLAGDDPYLVFWLATTLPIIGKAEYEKFIAANPWIYEILPNFDPKQNFDYYQEQPGLSFFKKILEIICFVPAMTLEPLLRRIHIQHTFNLPENHWPSSSTIANKQMLKLHAIDPRRDIRNRLNNLLQSLR